MGAIDFHAENMGIAPPANDNGEDCTVDTRRAVPDAPGTTAEGRTLGWFECRSGRKTLPEMQVLIIFSWLSYRRF